MKRKFKAEVTGVGETSSSKAQLIDFTTKQLRSRLPRRRRLQISPIVLVPVPGTASYFTAVGEFSCDSSIASVSNQKPPRVGDERLVYKTYYRKKCGKFDDVQELSVNSCVESSSCSGVNRELKLKSVNLDELEIQGGEVTKSEVSKASRFSFSEIDVGEVQKNDSSIDIIQKQIVLATPAVDKFFVKESTNPEAENDNSLDHSVVLLHSDDKTFEISENRAVAEQLRCPSLAFDIDLACSEKFSNVGTVNVGEEIVEEQNSSSSGMFGLTSVSELEFETSDYSQSSFWSYDSGSQFSEKSIGDESSSPTFELFGQFKQQFCRSTFELKTCDEHNSHETNVLGLELEEDEESYRMMRRREKKHYVHDYTVEYSSTTDYGELVIQQRLLMVHWIVEQSTDKELHMETMFLGISLLDRFFSKGYFKNLRNLQIAGIACLTLATRIEENQPDNSVRKKMFHVGSTVYGRCEVVAMEWLVQEVLNFQCFLPTLYNLLWFYLKAARANEHLEKTAKYLAVLALMGHQHLCYWPSTLGAGIVILASIATNQDATCHLVTAILSRQKDLDLPECLKSLEWLVSYL